MRPTLMFLFTVLCTVLLGAQPATSPRDEILAARKAWMSAFIRRDPATMARIETEDFMIIINGSVRDHSRLAAMRGLPPIVRTETVEVQRFELHGGLATMSGLVHMSSPDGMNAARALFSDVWVRKAGAWRIRSAHYSRPMPVEAAPRALPGVQPASDLPADLREAISQRDQAAKASDGDTWGRLVTDDHLGISAAGDIQSKSERMRGIGSVNRGTIVPERTGFRSYGSNVVIYTYEGAGTPRTFVSEVWIKGDAGWQMAHRQSTWK